MDSGGTEAGDRCGSASAFGNSRDPEPGRLQLQSGRVALESGYDGFDLGAVLHQQILPAAGYDFTTCAFEVVAKEVVRRRACGNGCFGIANRSRPVFQRVAPLQTGTGHRGAVLLVAGFELRWQMGLL